MSKNKFKGEFSSSEKEKEFLEIETEVFPNQFEDETNLKEITLPEVLKIGEAAFRGCSNLNKLKAGKLKTIEDEAFSGANFEYLEIGDVETIGVEAFADNEELESVDIQNVKYIGDGAFKDSPISELSTPGEYELGTGVFDSADEAIRSDAEDDEDDEDDEDVDDEDEENVDEIRYTESHINDEQEKEDRSDRNFKRGMKTIEAAGELNRFRRSFGGRRRRWRRGSETSTNFAVVILEVIVYPIVWIFRKWKAAWKWIFSLFQN